MHLVLIWDPQNLPHLPLFSPLLLIAGQLTTFGWPGAIDLFC